MFNRLAKSDVTRINFNDGYGVKVLMAVLKLG